MSGLQSMLMPLETLPGWPPAPDPSTLQFVGLLFGIPLLLALVIGSASYFATTRAERRFGPPVNPAVAYAVVPAGGGTEQTSAAIEAPPDAGAGTGGTSARW